MTASFVRLAMGLAISGLAITSVTFAVRAESPQSLGTWTMKTPMPTARAEMAAAVVGGKLYAIGGNIGGTAVPHNTEYDPATDTWRQRTPMPIARDHIGIAAVNGKIYTFGGFTHTVHQGASTDVLEYDPAMDSWLRRAPLRMPFGAVGAAVVEGKIHVIAGRGSDGKTVNMHAVYDPAADTWSEAAPLPLARDHLAVVAAEGKIHIIGGRLGATVDKTGQHDVYDPITDAWTSAAPMITPRSAPAGVLYHGLILVLGGELAPKTYVENEGYDLKSDKWVTLTPMPEGRHNFGSGVIGSDAYFVGGSLKPGVGEPTGQLIVFTLR
jgi:N-acetylneuraminic acid mutarotase